jgi:hypothetical protein
MALQLASNIIPSGGGTYYLMEDVYMKGGLQIRDSVADRDKIALANLKLGALVLTIDTKKIWQVSELVLQTKQNPDAVEKVTWTELELGGGGAGGDTGGTDGQLKLGKRAVAIYTCDNLQVDGSHEFEMELGAVSLALRIETSRPVRIRAFAKPEKDDDNPYEFISTADHLADDGRQMFADGTILRTRNYSILANFEDPIRNITYWTFDSIDKVEGPVVLTVTYLVQEIADQPPKDDEVVTTPSSTPTSGK